MPARIDVFISSKMKELREERDALYELLPKLSNENKLVELHAWQFEKDAPASPQPTRETYLESLKQSALYIGLFWNEYGEYTIDEFEHATEWGIDRLIFVKDVDAEERSPELQAFLKRIGHVEKGLTTKWVKTTEDLCIAVTESIQAWVEDQLGNREGELRASLVVMPDHVPDRPKVLFGRENESEAIHKWLDEGKHVLLHGFAGMGKTALAASVAVQRIQMGKGPLLWLPLGTANVNTAFEALAWPLRSQEAISSQSEPQRTLVLRDILHRRGINLLVLDNVWDWDVLEQVLKACPEGCAALAVSRIRYPCEQIISIEELTPKSALELLGYHAGKTYMNDAGAQELCATLGYHPFAVELAGMHLKTHPDRTPTTLSQSFPEGNKIDALIGASLEALDRKGKAETRKVFLTFGTLFSRKATPELLALAALGIPEVSDDMVTRFRSQLELDSVALSAHEIRRGLRHAIMERLDVKQTEEALTELESHGLIKFKPEAGATTSADVLQYQIHNLAFAYASRRLTEQERLKALDACLYYSECHRLPTLEDYNKLLAELDNLVGAADWAMSTGHTDAIERLARTLFARDSQLLGYGGFLGQAEKLLRQAIEAAQSPRNKAASLDRLGIVYRRSGRVHDAIQEFKQAVEIALSLNDRELEGRALGDLAVAFHDFGEYDSALNHFAQALTYSTDQTDRARHLGYQGVTYADRGSYDDAKKCYEEALSLLGSIESKHLEHERMRGAILGNWGNAYFDQGDYESALKLYNDALHIAQTTGDRRREGRHLGNIGNTYFHLGEYREALKYLSSALTIHDEVGDLRRKGRRSSQIASVYRDMGEYDLAKKHYEEALAISDQVGDRHGKVYTLNGLGVFYIRHGDTATAIARHGEALELAEEINNQRGIGYALIGLGAAYLQPGDDSEHASEHALLAKDYYERGHLISKKIGNVRGEVRALNGLGEVAIYLDDIEGAVNYNETALALAVITGNLREKIYALNNLGFAYTQNSQYELAESYLRQGLFAAKAIGFRQGTGDCLYSLGRLYEAQHKDQQAAFQTASTDKNTTLLELARANYRGALEIFTELGLKHKIKRCEP